jgi:hypothetical protein
MGSQTSPVTNGTAELKYPWLKPHRYNSMALNNSMLRVIKWQ